jgi:hypothetical protein
MKTWIRRQAASGKPLNVQAVMRERPDLLAKAYAGPQPSG